MKIDQLRQRLRPDRPMTTISMRIPRDVVDDLKRLAPKLGFSGYQPLIRAYVGQGMRHDLARLEGEMDIDRFVDSLRRQGVDEEAITRALDASQVRLASGG